MDAFFASVEIRDNPQLKGKPVAVGGSEIRGVVSTASYEARKYGVKSAMSGVLAKKLCPDLIFVKPRFEAYKAASQAVFAILEQYSERIESMSLDEAYIDVSENAIPASEIARQIKNEIYEKTKLTASAGVSFNKFLAKVASDYKKPNGLTVIKPAVAARFIDELPIEKFYGVGKVTAEKMKNAQILSGKDLKKYSEDDLYNMFGKSGVFYYKCAHCLDERPVVNEHVRKSVGHERTFSKNLIGKENIENHLQKINAELNVYLKKKNIKGRTITLKIKYQDFTINTRSISISDFTNDESIIMRHSLHLLTEPFFPKDEIRLLGITLSNLEHENKAVKPVRKISLKPVQLSLPLLFN